MAAVSPTDQGPTDTDYSPKQTCVSPGLLGVMHLTVGSLIWGPAQLTWIPGCILICQVDVGAHSEAEKM